MGRVFFFKLKSPPEAILLQLEVKLDTRNLIK
jgi:hypothetical protein